MYGHLRTQLLHVLECCDYSSIYVGNNSTSMHGHSKRRWDSLLRCTHVYNNSLAVKACAAEILIRSGQVRYSYFIWGTVSHRLLCGTQYTHLIIKVLLLLESYHDWSFTVQFWPSTNFLITHTNHPFTQLLQGNCIYSKHKKRTWRWLRHRPLP